MLAGSPHEGERRGRLGPRGRLQKTHRRRPPSPSSRSSSPLSGSGSSSPLAVNTDWLAETALTAETSGLGSSSSWERGVCAVSAVSATRTPIWGFICHRRGGRPPFGVLKALNSRTQPERVSTSSRVAVCSASSFCPKASRRTSSSEISFLRRARIQRSVRRALTCRSVRPICRREARACGQKYSLTSRMRRI